MGCNKSKSQHARSKANVNEEYLSPWELGQEANEQQDTTSMLYCENFEFNQNGISSSGFHSDSDFYNDFGNSKHQTEHRYSNANDTGSFGDSSPANDLNSVHYFSANDKSINVQNQNSLPSHYSVNTALNQDQLQGHYKEINQEHFHSAFNQEHSCGPYTQCGPSANISNNENNRKKEEINQNSGTDVILYENLDQSNCYDDDPFNILHLLLFPEEWSSCAIDKTGLVDISLISPEGKSLQNYFSRSSYSKDFKLCITAISRIENPFMHSYYLLKKQEMESRNEHVDELYLYHGTKKEYLPSIFEDNLNWRLYSEKHKFGQGVSFSPFATYSSHYSDKTPEKVMLLFKVLVSNSIGGTPDMKVPPTYGDVVYDASIKDDTSVIVKYTDNEFYPLYKITYEKIMRIS